MNVQVHCEQCDRSLYRTTFIGSVSEALAAETVVLTHGDRAEFDPRMMTGWGRMEFCDYECVEAWARRRKADVLVERLEAES